ncbi:cytochrome P450 [Sphingobium sp. Sx8-8]|uniref:cytochrome P450 n=1 Tax=Sphingobium sp. Sx8-8 TaxID=2933617 RepID=UPI001F571B8E
MISSSSTNALPAHVSPEQVRPFPYILGHKTTADPYSFVPEIRNYPPIFWAEKVINGVDGAWVPRRAEDVRKVFSDSEHFTVRDMAPFARLCGESWFLVPAEVDPPLHTVLRSTVNPLFTPKKMALLEGKIRQYAREYVREMAPRGQCNFMNDFAFEFPIRVFLELMGLPQERVAEFLSWEHSLLHEPDIAKIIDATRAVNAYLAEECESRRRAPRDDLITFAVQADVKGRPMTDDEITGFCFNLFIGGLDTVSTNMGLQFRHLAERPDHQATLRENPEKIPAALDELMRAYSPILNRRECIKEVEIAGQKILPGDKIMVPAFLAGRDPEEFPNPDEVILDRKPRHVTFGYGVHTCIGMHLARREMRIGMEEFLSGIPEFRIAPGAVVESYLAGTIQPVEIPLVWEAA